MEPAREECTDHAESEALAVTLNKTIAEKDQRIAKAKTAEAAQSFAAALEIYETYAMEGDVKRVLPSYAKQKETEGDFLSAYSIYEKGGASADMQRVLAMRDEQLAEYGKARVLLVEEGKFIDALAIYRRFKNSAMEKDALRQQGAFLQGQGKFDDAMELYREAQLAEEIARVKKFVSTRESNLKEGRQQEQAANYDKAIELFQKANSPKDVCRVASDAAKTWEAKKDFALAAEYYEIAGMYEDAGHIRKDPSFASSISQRRLTDTEIVKRCAPACVTIENGGAGGGLGSGFFVAKGGYILTNNHVIAGATTIRVITASGITLNAKLVKASEVPDLALLKVELESHPILALADSDKAETGGHVAAIGSPKGLSQSFTAGSISNTERDYEGNKCFQISVLINHGNSGGPLINEAGQAIGINTFGEGTALIVKGKGIGSDIQGINYAIKINEAKRVFKGTVAF